MSEPAKSTVPPEEQRVPVHYDTRPPVLTRWQRLQIPVIGWAGWAVLRVVGPTLRFEVVGGERAGRARDPRRPCILTFWHRMIFSGTWWFRNRGVVVMNSTNFDGQWTRRVIERMGYGTAQGSSTRGGLRGLAVMARKLEEGFDAGFSIDGPRGPRYVAKPGPVLLARRTGRPIVPFHIALEHAKTLQKTWDLFQIPHLFTRAVLVFAPPIEVSQDADRDEVERKHAEMQSALERVRDLADSWFSLSEADRKRERAALES